MLHGGLDLGSSVEVATGCYPLMLAHTDTDSHARRVSEHMESDYMAGGMRAKVTMSPDGFLFNPIAKLERLKEKWMDLGVQHVVVQLCQ